MYFNKVSGGNDDVVPLSMSQELDVKERWKHLGKSLSTARMAIRIFGWLDPLRVILRMLKNPRESFNTKEKLLNLVMQCLDMGASFLDNLVWLNRSEIRKFTTDWQAKWINWGSSLCCFIFINL